MIYFKTFLEQTVSDTNRQYVTVSGFPQKNKMTPSKPTFRDF